MHLVCIVSRDGLVSCLAYTRCEGSQEVMDILAKLIYNDGYRRGVIEATRPLDFQGNFILEEEVEQMLLKRRENLLAIKVERQWGSRS